MSESKGKTRAAPPKGRIDFHYDASNDVLIATPHWVIETEVDVADWYDQYAAHLQKYGRKMDMVIVLDFFEIKPAIGVVWGEARGRIHKQFTRFNYRVHATNRVKLFVNTSGVRYDVATEEAATIEGAVEGILAARRAAKAAT